MHGSDHDESLRRELAREWREANAEWVEAKREFERLAGDPHCDPLRVIQSRCRLDFAIWRRVRLLADVRDPSEFAFQSTQRVSLR